MQLGPFEVLRSLGGGGMSEALLARSPQGRLVVLKRPLKRDAELIARMRDEARLGSRLFHAHLVETLDVIDVDGVPIVVVAYVEGPTVDDIRKSGALSPAAAARVGCHVAEALSALHGALGDDGKPMRTVHRDVTGRNVVVRGDGEAVLIDLGIAKSEEARAARTETGMIIGTIRYLAPELIDGVAPSPASDLWALGCVIFEAVTGEPAFVGAPSEVAGRIATQDPLATDRGRAIEPRLRAVLARLFEKDPKKRVAHAHEASALFRSAEEALGGGKESLASRARARLTVDAASVRTEGPPPTAPAWTPPAAPVPAPFVAGAGPGVAARPPVVHRDVSLELDRPVKAARPVEVQPQRSDFYPTHKADHRWILAGLKQLLLWGVVLGVIAAGYWYWTDQEAQEEAAALARKLESDTRLLQKAMEETAPPCSGPGTSWAYEDAKGTTVVVDEASQIPKRFRKTSRCVTLSGR